MNKKEISHEYYHEYYLAHRDKIKARHLAYYQSHKVERQNYYSKNRDKIRAQNLGYYYSQKQEVLAKQKEYKRRHTIRYGSEYKKKTGKKDIYGLNKPLYPLDNQCPYCGRQISLTYHHWRDEDYNDGVWLCRRCHSRLEHLLWSMPIKKDAIIDVLKIN